MTAAPLASKLDALLAARVVPVLRYQDAATAAYAAEVAVAAGCTTLELTWTIPGVTDLVRALRLPVLAMAGDRDGSTPPDLVRATADLCSADYHVIPHAGHIPCVEQPAATARLLADFLERTAP